MRRVETTSAPGVPTPPSPAYPRVTDTALPPSAKPITPQNAPRSSAVPAASAPAEGTQSDSPQACPEGPMLPEKTTARSVTTGEGSAHLNCASPLGNSARKDCTCTARGNSTRSHASSVMVAAAHAAWPEPPPREKKRLPPSSTSLRKRRLHSTSSSVAASTRTVEKTTVRPSAASGTGVTVTSAEMLPSTAPRTTAAPANSTTWVE